MLRATVPSNNCIYNESIPASGYGATQHQDYILAVRPLAIAAYSWPVNDITPFDFLHQGGVRGKLLIAIVGIPTIQHYGRESYTSETRKDDNDAVIIVGHYRQVRSTRCRFASTLRLHQLVPSAANPWFRILLQQLCSSWRDYPCSTSRHRGRCLQHRCSLYATTCCRMARCDHELSFLERHLSSLPRRWASPRQPECLTCCDGHVRVLCLVHSLIRTLRLWCHTTAGL